MRHPQVDRQKKRTSDRRRIHLHDRYALASFRVGNEWDHVAFRDYILAAAASVPGVTTQADIARMTAISPSVLSKWFRGEERPSDANLRRLQLGFAERGVKISMRGMARLVGRIFDDEEDGEEGPIAPPQPEFGHIRAREIDQILAPSSPVSEEDKQALDTVLDRLIDPYRRQMKRRRSA